MIDMKTLAFVAVVAAVTALTRFLPFFVFGGKLKMPKIVDKLSKTLPYAIMGMLVVYCLKSTSFVAVSGFLPQLIACAVVVILHVWKRNTLVSILFGTVTYMLLVQIVF